MAILQARILEWVAMPFFRGSSHHRDRSPVSRIAGRFFTVWATRATHTGVLYDWCNPFSSGSSWPRSRTGVSCIAGRFFTSWATRETPGVGWALIPTWLVSLYKGDSWTQTLTGRTACEDGSGDLEAKEHQRLPINTWRKLGVRPEPILLVVLGRNHLDC